LNACLFKSDAIAAHGFAHEIANYGEYSGAPTEAATYEYAKTILDLMTRGTPHALGKILFIGGGIANFTNVASTFKGIIRALSDFKRLIKAHGVKIYVRRAGPNYQEGLRLMRNTASDLELDMQVFGPEMFVTGIVPLALTGDTKGISKGGMIATSASSNSLMDMNPPANAAVVNTPSAPAQNISFESAPKSPKRAGSGNVPFDEETRSFIYGMQPRAVQGMLDFDHMCKRSRPSVAAMIYPFGGVRDCPFYIFSIMCKSFIGELARRFCLFTHLLRKL
jgi:ATP citrate (pro-S)-lyase